MEYEILNLGSTYTPNDVYVVCPVVNNGCPEVNFICFGDVHIICGGDDGGGDDGNVFPCENPGLGCRHGCGGATGEMCARPVSF